jgi:hypothetical protein
MMRVHLAAFSLLICSAAAVSDDAPRSEVKTMSGMSLLGNQEAPKSLVIVPWKSSELGDPLAVTSVLDERARPVDREVFLRELNYYDIRTGRTSPVSAR